jgi:hypothetical protein
MKITNKILEEMGVDPVMVSHITHLEKKEIGFVLDSLMKLGCRLWITKMATHLLDAERLDKVIEFCKEQAKDSGLHPTYKTLFEEAVMRKACTGRARLAISVMVISSTDSYDTSVRVTKLLVDMMKEQYTTKG